MAVARELAISALQRLFSDQTASVDSQVLVFTDPGTFDLVPLAVQWGRAVAVDHDGPEVEQLEKLLAELIKEQGPIGPYALGTRAVERFLAGKEAVPISSRDDVLRRLGLNPKELPPVVKKAIESTQQYLNIFA